MATFFSLGNKITSVGDEFNYGTNADGDCCCGDVEGDSAPTFMPQWNVNAGLGAGSFKFKMPIRAKRNGQYYGNKFRGWLKCSFSRGGSAWASKITLPQGKTAYVTEPTSAEMFTDDELAIPEGENGHVKEWTWYGTYWSENMGTPTTAYRETVGYLDSKKDWSDCSYSSDTSFGYKFKTAPESCNATGGEAAHEDAYCGSDSYCRRGLEEDPMGVADCVIQEWIEMEDCYGFCTEHHTGFDMHDCCPVCTRSEENACWRNLYDCYINCGATDKGDQCNGSPFTPDMSTADDDCVAECENQIGNEIPDCSDESNWCGPGKACEQFVPDGECGTQEDFQSWLDCSNEYSQQWNADARTETVIDHICDCHWDITESVQQCCEQPCDADYDMCIYEAYDNGYLPCLSQCGCSPMPPFQSDAWYQCAECQQACSLTYTFARDACTDARNACNQQCSDDISNLWYADLGYSGKWATRDSSFYSRDAHSDNRSHSNAHNMPYHCKYYQCSHEGQVELDPRADSMNLYNSIHGCSGPIINNTSMGFRALSGGGNSALLLFSDKGPDDIYTSASDCSYSLTGRAEGYEGPDQVRRLQSGGDYIYYDVDQWGCDGKDVDPDWRSGCCAACTDCAESERAKDCNQTVSRNLYGYKDWDDLKGSTNHASDLRAFLPMDLAYTGTWDDGLSGCPAPGRSSGSGGYSQANLTDHTDEKLCFCNTEISGLFRGWSSQSWMTQTMSCKNPDKVKEFAQKAKSYIDSGGGAKASEPWPGIDARLFGAPDNTAYCGGSDGWTMPVDIKCSDYDSEEVDKTGYAGYTSVYRNYIRNQRGGSPQREIKFGDQNFHCPSFPTIYSAEKEGHWYMDHPQRKMDGCQDNYMQDNYWHPDMWEWPYYSYNYPDDRSETENSSGVHYWLEDTLEHRKCPLNSNEEDCFEWEIDLTDKFYSSTSYSYATDDTLLGGLPCAFPWGAGMKKTGTCGAKTGTFENHLPEEFGGDGILPPSVFYIWIDGDDEIEFTIDCPWSSHYINKLIAAEHLTKTPWMDGCYIDGTGCSRGSPEFDNLVNECNGSYCNDPTTATHRVALNPNTTHWSFTCTPYVQDNGGPGWRAKPSKHWDDEDSEWYNAVQYGGGDCEMPVHPDFDAASDCSPYTSWEDFEQGKIIGLHSCVAPVPHEPGWQDSWDDQLGDCIDWTLDPDGPTHWYASNDFPWNGTACRYYESHSPHVCCGCRDQLYGVAGPFPTPPYYCLDQPCDSDDYACSRDGGATEDVAAHAEGRC